ncbi:SRPBCC family protein [Micromonospora sp. C95]|uniref:SRPBCC family protein n=1 Tax=Micromonospora sp. C95 TaxID=2824882 RepID=UPI001B36FCA9|nr:SRPBCC family protein [Micromonospora sp. C95]MBQ1027242.1 SRPBCC family protein [Micromonospora sp. C95]
MAYSERGVSAPPEVVFNTATDPDRISSWLPEPLLSSGPAQEGEVEQLRARWTAGGADWTAELRVEPVDAGGSRLRLEIGGGGEDADRLADEALDSLAREVADNLQAG